MKSLRLASLLLLLVAAPVLAVPYNTIVVNGTWDAGEWDQTNETFASNTFPGWNEYGNVRSILVTWDASNLYVGVRGNSWNNAMLIYIDSSSLTTGQENADYFQGYVTQPTFDPDFVAGHFNMEWGSGGVPTDIRSISPVDGTTTSLLGTAQIAVHDQGHDGGLGEGLTEIAIPWSVIGLETYGSVRVAAGVGWANNSNPVIPAGGLGGFSGDELGGADQSGGTDGDPSTLDGPTTVVYDNDGDGLPDQLEDYTPPSLIQVAALEGDNSVVVATFDEPVEQISAENTANWMIDGELLVTGAAQQADPAVIHLQLDGAAVYGSPYLVTADGIEDDAGNISGPTSARFCLAQITFQVHMEYVLLEDPTGPQEVAIEGGVAPLTWDPTCDDPMFDDGTHGDATAGDSLYTTQIDFCLSYDDGEEAPVVPLTYKFTYGCTQWEDVDHFFASPGITCATGQVSVEVWWNDLNPENYTTHAIDVVFSVDVSDSLFRQTVGINGGTDAGGPIPPLNWNVPSENLLSDTDYPDGVADDGVYGIAVRFPETSLKFVNFKYLFDDHYECTGQGNRTVYLNDAAFDTLGGAMGPLVLPTGRIDRCTVTKQDVRVVFRADLSTWYDPPLPGDVIAVNGTPNNQEPQIINWDIPSINPMADDGFGPDEAAGDLVYTRMIEFPDSSNLVVQYKYLFNEAYECTTQANRWLWIDSYSYDDSGNPQILDVDIFNLCGTVDAGETGAPAAPARLDANYPNPFNPTTTLSFTLQEAGPIRLQVYDIAGRLVRTLIDAEAPAGEHIVSFDGRDDAGRGLPSGIYFARLSAAGQVESRKMTLLK